MTASRVLDKDQIADVVRRIFYRYDVKKSEHFMMGDDPDDPVMFPEDRIGVRMQPRREARADTREPDFKYPT